MLRTHLLFLCLGTVLLLTARHAAARPWSLRDTAKLITGSHSVNYYPRPSYEERGRMARWLVHEMIWGTLATLDRTTGDPIGGVVSHSDGPRYNATGRLYFYITPMDELTQNIMAYPRCSYTISEQQGRGDGGAFSKPCAGVDPEDPACARATLLGEMRAVPQDQLHVAQEAVFSRHPAMASWPAGHNFQLYELHVDAVHLLNWYGGMVHLTGDEYYASDLQRE